MITCTIVDDHYIEKEYFLSMLIVCDEKKTYTIYPDHMMFIFPLEHATILLYEVQGDNIINYNVEKGLLSFKNNKVEIVNCIV